MPKYVVDLDVTDDCEDCPFCRHATEGRYICSAYRDCCGREIKQQWRFITRKDYRCASKSMPRPTWCPLKAFSDNVDQQAWVIASYILDALLNMAVNAHKYVDLNGIEMIVETARRKARDA